MKFKVIFFLFGETPLMLKSFSTFSNCLGSDSFWGALPELADVQDV